MSQSTKSIKIINKKKNRKTKLSMFEKFVTLVCYHKRAQEEHVLSFHCIPGLNSEIYCSS